MDLLQTTTVKLLIGSAVAMLIWQLAIPHIMSN
jgi:hypothetical protein